MDYKKMYEEVKQVVENEYKPTMKQIDEKLTDLVKENEKLKEKNAKLQKKWEEHTDSIVETYFANTGCADITQKDLDKLKDENAELKEQVENYPQSAEGYEDEEILEMIELKEEWDINIEPLCIGDCSQLATEINDRKDEIEELEEKIEELKKKLSTD